MAAVTIYSDSGAQETKVFQCFHCFPICLPWSDGTGCHDLHFWILSFRLAFSLSSFTFIKRLFSSFSLSSIRVVSSAYMRLLVFLPAILIPACASSSLPGASVRNSAHGKGHEEGGLAYAKAWSSLRKSPVPEHLTPKPESVLCSHLHLWLYRGLSPITVSLGEGVNVQLHGNKNSWAWQECFSLQTPLKVI